MRWMRKLRRLKWTMAFFCLTSGLFAQKESLLIGPGDLLHVRVFDTPSLDEDVRVTDAGDLPLILGGNVKVASLTSEEAARAIEQTLIGKQIMLHPRVLVTIEQYATENVSVIGQVIRPGEYPINTARSVLDVLTIAGGLTDLADRHVTIERHLSGETITYFVSNDPHDLLKHSVLVYPGDKVLVAKTGIIYVLGDVARPGGYPMANNQSALTVLQALAGAGGTTPSAVPSKAKLIRRVPDGGLLDIHLPLSDMQKGKKPDQPLQAGDILYVPFSYLRNAALGITGVAASAASAVIYAHP
jgi:polysaccharide biosynthesis/export protein